MFNSQASVSTQSFGQQTCVIVDDALADAQALCQLAARNWAAFDLPLANAFPGPELALPETAAWAFAEAMLGWGADALGLECGESNIKSVFARLSVVTKQARELDPIQRLCHRDRLNAPSGYGVMAGVLYLFRNSQLGGTNFFKPLDVSSVDELMRWAGTASHSALDLRIGAERGYLCQSNAWFELVTTIPARFNRLLIYDGGQFHGSAIRAASLLSPDPIQGRLAINVFAVVRRK